MPYHSNDAKTTLIYKYIWHTVGIWWNKPSGNQCCYSSRRSVHVGCSCFAFKVYMLYFMNTNILLNNIDRLCSIFDQGRQATAPETMPWFLSSISFFLLHVPLSPVFLFIEPMHDVILLRWSKIKPYIDCEREWPFLALMNAFGGRLYWVSVF